MTAKKKIPQKASRPAPRPAAKKTPVKTAAKASATPARREKAVATREALLDAAEKVFYEHGVARARLEDIAATAGMTRGAVYWHFKDKTDILTALLMRLHNEWFERLRDVLGRKSATLKSFEDFIAEATIDLEKDERKRRVLSIFFLKCDDAGDLGAFNEVKKKSHGEILALYTDFFGRVLPADFGAPPAQVALAFDIYASGMISEGMRHGMFSIAREARGLWRIFFRSLEAAPVAAKPAKARPRKA